MVQGECASNYPYIRTFKDSSGPRVTTWVSYRADNEMREDGSLPDEICRRFWRKEECLLMAVGQKAIRFLLRDVKTYKEATSVIDVWSMRLGFHMMSHVRHDLMLTLSTSVNPCILSS